MTVEMIDRDGEDNKDQGLLDREYVLPDGTRKKLRDFTRKDGEAWIATKERTIAALLADSN